MKKITSVDQYIQSIPASRGKEISWLREIIMTNDLNLEENIKWGTPVYSLNGKNVVGITAFKSYVGLWFFQGIFLKDPFKYLVNAQEGVTKAQRQWRFQDLEQLKLHKNHILDYIKEATWNANNELEMKPKKNLEPVVLSIEFETRLKENSEAFRNFYSLSKSHQRAYVSYINEAKRLKTKLIRIEKSLIMLVEKKLPNI
ncbi:MAG: YdeI/OmpD-associated family protein [Saprospiraceae bacterium]|nr:YdeI/OmpD-associated family protein [Saprospiraceae bacterium]